MYSVARNQIPLAPASIESPRSAVLATTVSIYRKHQVRSAYSIFPSRLEVPGLGIEESLSKYLNVAMGFSGSTSNLREKSPRSRHQANQRFGIDKAHVCPPPFEQVITSRTISPSALPPSPFSSFL